MPAAAIGVWWFERRRNERASAWAPASLLANMASRPGAWHRYLPTALLLAGLALLLVGFARPQATVHVKRQEATVVLVLDVSGSMAARDAVPSRLGAARAAAQRIVDRLPGGYNVALVTFSDHAAVVQPPTQDRNAIRAAIARARTGPQGTALASAVARAVDVAISVKGGDGKTHPPADIIVFSDGGQTAGRITPQQAGALAAKQHVPVATVSVGTADGIVTQKLQGGFSERIEVPAQPAALKAIAQRSGARFYPHAMTFDPSALIARLGSRVGSRAKRVEVTAAAAAGGLVFMLAGGLLSGAWFRRVP